MPATPYLEFQSAIFDSSQADTTPADLTGITPGAGVFTPGGRDLVKNIVGHLIANGGWTLLSIGGADPATYTLSSVGISGFDLMLLEIGWDTTRGFISTRMGTGLSNGALVNPSSAVMWPVTNGGSIGANTTRLVNCYVYADKDTLAGVLKESVSGYSMGFGPFGMIKRFAGTTPTGAAQAGKDYTAWGHALPSMVVGQYQYTDGHETAQTQWGTDTYGRQPSIYNDGSSYGFRGPRVNGYDNARQGGNYTAAYQSPWYLDAARTLPSNVNMPSNNGYMTIDCFRVFQHNGDASASWVPLYFVNGIGSDGSVSLDNAYLRYTGAATPQAFQPTLGMDGFYHLERERLFQYNASAYMGDANPKLRGFLPGVVYAGPNAGTEFTEINTGAEVYKRFNINCGYWPRINGKGYALRKA